MDQSEECMNNKQKGKRKQNWSGDQTKLMLHLIREEQVSGRVAGSGTFTKQFWKKLATVLSSQSEPERHGEECKTRWKTLKQDFSEYKQCREKTGWGWCATKRVPVGPEDEWEELKTSNSKLYKCKTKPFDWYNEMLEIVGGNVANGSSAAAYKPDVPLEDLVDLSDSSGSNRDIGQDLNEVNMDAIRAQWGTEISMLGEEFDDEINMQPSPLPRSGAASRTSSGKRVLEQSDGVECDAPASKKFSGNKNKCDDPTSKKSSGACLQDFLVESQKRSVIMENKANKDKLVAEKLIKVHNEGKVSQQDFIILQRIVKDSELMKELFLSMEDNNLDWWIPENIALYRQERGFYT